ncbi:MAG: hypothetical protein AB7O67_04325 [Vicinamibacterales bacterium]
MRILVIGAAPAVAGQLEAAAAAAGLAAGVLRVTATPTRGADWVLVPGATERVSALAATGLPSVRVIEVPALATPALTAEQVAAVAEGLARMQVIGRARPLESRAGVACAGRVIRRFRSRIEAADAAARARAEAERAEAKARKRAIKHGPQASPNEPLA